MARHRNDSAERISPAARICRIRCRVAVLASHTLQVVESDECISGLILQGVRKPHDCPAFGKTCTPERPLGATMVSSEGACAAYYNYGRFRKAEPVHA